ncbi:MAG: hypothetical protein JW991_00805 [Candidatus Pacebacteria bacterium]|nr:hypothetical protein [Candidatus Paceibacterota bacterium]
MGEGANGVKPIEDQPSKPIADQETGQEHEQDSDRLGQYLDHLVKERKVPPEQEERFRALAKEVYSQTREVVAPVYILLADKVLTKLKNEPDSLALTLARDGLPIHIAAQKLREKVAEYQEIDPGRTRYLHYNGQFNPLVRGTAHGPDFYDRYRGYLRQMGVAKAKKVILADSQSAVGLSYRGLTGLINDVNPEAEIEGEFVDLWPNGTRNTHGILEEGSDPDFHLNVYKNRLQLVEALYSGVYNSATDIVLDQDSGQYIPVITRKNPTEKTAIKGLSAQSLVLLNEVAIRGIEDATDDYDSIKTGGVKAAVDKFVGFVAGEETRGIRLLKEVVPWQRRAEEWYLYDQYWTEPRKKKWAARPDQVEALKKKYESPPLPDPQMHEPDRVKAFIEGYLERMEEEPRETKLQMVGIKSLQNPELIDRFLEDFAESRQKSAYQGEVGVFIIDDSWDDEAARQIAKVAKKYQVGYYRVRENTGFAQRLAQKVAQELKADPDLTEKQRRYQFWLSRALLKDRLQAPLREDLESFEFADPLAELGGIAGTQNFGYLAAAYEAGKRGVPLKETTITINEDDQRYRTLTRTEEGTIRTDQHDILAERAAWFEDPETQVTIGRYTGHTGNPISLVKDTLELTTQIMTERNSGAFSTYNIFDPETGAFRQVSTSEAYRLLPQILEAAVRRQPIAALWTEERHFKEGLDWQEASKLDLGNITFSGEAIKGIPTPLGGIFDYNLSGAIRAQAATAADPNRVIRRERPLMHQRAARQGGGDAFGAEMVGAFSNNYAREQFKISKAIDGSPSLQNEAKQALGIAPADDKSLQASIRTFEANHAKLEEIKRLRGLLDAQVEFARQIDSAEPDQVIDELESFLHAFPEGAIEAVEKDLENQPLPKEIRSVRKGVRRYLRTYQVWPSLVDAAYELGAEEKRLSQAKKEKEDPEVPIASEQKSQARPVEVGYLPGVSAHTGRPLEVALELARAGVPTNMCGSESGRQVFDLGRGFETPGKPVTVERSDDYFYHPGHLIKGEFSVKEMAGNVVRIAQRLEENPPPFVLSDHNVPLLMAAKMAGVPTVSITNLSNVGFTSEAFIHKLGPEAERLADKYYRPLDPKLRQVYQEAHRQYIGEPPTDNPSWFQHMEAADLTIIADNEAFVNQGVGPDFNLDPRLRELVNGNEVAYVGSIQPETIINQYVDEGATKEAVAKLAQAKLEGKKIIFGSFGSIKEPKLYQALFAVAQKRPEAMIMVTTADAELPADLPENFVPVKFANLPELASHADVLLCQGGSGTLYPFMKRGRGGIITITTNADQQYNAALVEQHGLGQNLPLSRLDNDRLDAGIQQALTDQATYAARMSEISPRISLEGAKKAAAIIKEKFSL